ncbi:MAG TPA: NAD(+) synthase, partial [Oculatellaceae cyanobacterium]
ISRATLLRQLGNEFRALPVATSDKSELYLGYATVNGDMSGALAPLGDLPKTKVRALAQWLNHHRPPHVKTPRDVIPAAVIQRPSGADLKRDPKTGKLVTAEDELMPYEFADEVIWRIEALRQSFEEMLKAPFQYEERYVLSPEKKAEWLQKFYNRMARAVFKWFVAPPILITEGNGSIAKTDYHHPIVAGKICWTGHTDAEIAGCLDSCREALAPP